MHDLEKLSDGRKCSIMSNRPPQVVYASGRRTSRGFRVTMIILRVILLLMSLILLVAWLGETISGRDFDKHFAQGGRALDEERYNDAIHEYQAAIADNDS